MAMARVRNISKGGYGNGNTINNAHDVIMM